MIKARKYLALRQRARTDLYFLANYVLAPSYSRIIVPHAHGAILDHCQKFKGYREAIEPKTGRIVAAELRSPIEDLEGSRDNLILASRGFLKTTIHTIAHGVQWIVNYPDIRMTIGTATAEQNERVISELKGHFQFNNLLRWLFPEFCPPAKKAADWGSRTEFTVPNRKRSSKEPTVMGLSLGKPLASTHHDVMKFTDVVTEANTKTKGQIQETKDWFGYSEPLRERFTSKEGRSNVAWKDVEGTIYDHSDYHAMIVRHQRDLAEAERTWKITVQSCWADKAKRIPRWPERYPAAELDRILNSPEVGPYIFSAQYELNPVDPGSGLATFEQIKFFPAKVARQLMPRYRIATTIDLATLDGTNVKGDYCAMVTGGFDPDGRLDVLSVQRGRFTDEKLIELMFLLQKVYPRNQEFRIQKDQISGGLKTLLRREMEKRRVWLNVRYVPIPSNESKTHRIIRNLRGWFALGLIRFSDAIEGSTRNAIVDEILHFPKGEHDDFLDALADQMHDADGDPSSATIPRGPAEAQEAEMDETRGFNPYGNVWTPEDESACYAEVTGL